MTHHQEPEREWVLARSLVRWAWIGFIACILYLGWFSAVLLGEVLGWTDDPGAWAGLPNAVWAFLGLALNLALLVFLLALLIRREEPARWFTVAEDGSVGPGSDQG